MAGETIVTVVGNLTADAELRHTPQGLAVANFTIASTPRVYDADAREWKDGEALFLRSSCWRDLAENAAVSLTKGTRVIAQGRLRQRSFEKDGQTRTVIELEVDEIGPSLRHATAQVTRRGGGGGQRQQQAPQQQSQEPWGASTSQAAGGWPAAEPGNAWGQS